MTHLDDELRYIRFSSGCFEGDGRPRALSKLTAWSADVRNARTCAGWGAEQPDTAKYCHVHAIPFI